MNRRCPNKAIDHREVRLLRSAVHEASRHLRPLNVFIVFITLRPGSLDEPPSDPGRYFQAELKKVGNWFLRNYGPWWALWVRENYDGLHREHLHLLIHVPPRLRAAFGEAVARWWPTVKVAELVDADEPEDVLAYMLKQMTTHARFALRGRVRRETRSRHDFAKVAPVLGKRVGVTRTLTRSVQAKAKCKARVRRLPQRILQSIEEEGGR